MLAGVLDRDGQQLSATQTRNQALADADHLALLHAIWTAETTPARQQRYRDLLRPRCRPATAGEPGHQAKWLWRTLRAAELAGLDPAQILADAIAERDLAGARDIARRHRRPHPAPHSAPWSRSRPARGPRRSPPSPTPNAAPTLTEIAALMDARKDRIGEHAAEHAPPWAVSRPRPGPRATRWTGWTGRSGPPPSAPGGNCPATTTPPTRSAPSPPRPPRTCGRPGMRPSPPSARPTDPMSAACPTGRLLHLRDTYPIETAWAPQ